MPGENHLRRIQQIMPAEKGWRAAFAERTKAGGVAIRCEPLVGWALYEIPETDQNHEPIEGGDMCQGTVGLVRVEPGWVGFADDSYGMVAYVAPGESAECFLVEAKDILEWEESLAAEERAEKK